MSWEIRAIKKKLHHGIEKEIHFCVTHQEWAWYKHKNELNILILCSSHLHTCPACVYSVYGECDVCVYGFFGLVDSFLWILLVRFVCFLFIGIPWPLVNGFYALAIIVIYPCSSIHISSRAVMLMESLSGKWIGDFHSIFGFWQYEKWNIVWCMVYMCIYYVIYFPYFTLYYGQEWKDVLASVCSRARTREWERTKKMGRMCALALATRSLAILSINGKCHQKKIHSDPSHLYIVHSMSTFKFRRFHFGSRFSMAKAVESFSMD